MIKLQDFAAQNKVTDRAIQKHLKNHEKELEGHFERKGPGGTWLDEYACAYIKDLMRIQTIVVSEDEESKKRILELEKELAAAKGAGAAIKQLYDEEKNKNLELSHAELLLTEKAKEIEKLKDENERLVSQNKSLAQMNIDEGKMHADAIESLKKAHQEMIDQLNETHRLELEAERNKNWFQRWKERFGFE